MKKRLILVSVILFVIIVGTVAVMKQKREINEAGTSSSVDDEEYGRRIWNDKLSGILL